MYDSEFTYLRERIDSISDTLSKNTAILESNTESLREHMRRTAMLEEQMEMALIPIQFIKWSVYVLGVLGTIAGAAAGLWQLLH